MLHQFKSGVLFLLVTGLFSCGGSEDSQQPNLDTSPENSTPIILPEKELTTDEIVADPSATFKTSNKINYSVLNETNLNVTLFITNSSGSELARYYIKAGEFTDVTIQLDTAVTEIGMRWHYLEQVKKERILVADLSHINFSGF